MREKEGYRFGWVSIINHWTVALLFLSVLSLGFYLEFVGAGRGPGGPLMGIHKGAGVLLLALALWRIIWRLLQGFPKDVSHMPAWQVFMAKLVHWVLLFAIVAMPVSGILMSLYGDRSINVLGLFILPAQPENELVNRVADAFHWCLAYLVSITIFMHVSAVVKHHVLDKDDTLRRMLKPRKQSRASSSAGNVKTRPMARGVGPRPNAASRPSTASRPNAALKPSTVSKSKVK